MNWNLISMSVLFISAGLYHFINPKMYEKIIPPFFIPKKMINIGVGLLEVLLGVGLLFTTTQSISALGIIILLIAVFPSNLYMCMNQKASLGVPKVILYLRLPLQFLLIYWAYSNIV